jgi:hypothetical protein
MIVEKRLGKAAFNQKSIEFNSTILLRWSEITKGGCVK